MRSLALIASLGGGLALAVAPHSGSDPLTTATVATASPSALVVEAPPTLTAIPAAPTAMAPARTAVGGPIPDGYRIEIPRLGIDLPVQEGDLHRDVDEQRTPEGYAFHLPGTAIPGQDSNTFLYAHARRGMFLSLWNARPGDEVLIRAPNGATHTYVVGEILARVAPTDVSTTRPGSGEQLTLQTSTGPNPGDPRFVVLAFPRVERPLGTIMPAGNAQ